MALGAGPAAQASRRLSSTKRTGHFAAPGARALVLCHVADLFEIGLFKFCLLLASWYRLVSRQLRDLGADSVIGSLAGPKILPRIHLGKLYCNLKGGPSKRTVAR